MREIVVPDFRFIGLLAKRLGNGEDRLVFGLLLGTGGRRSEVAGIKAGDVDLPARRVWTFIFVTVLSLIYLGDGVRAHRDVKEEAL